MKLVVLYPGAMKPFHDGHLSLLESYISNNDNIIPDTVHIIISPSERSGIKAVTTEKFIKSIDFSKINKKCNIQIQVAQANPIVACYAICGHCEDPDVRFVLASSEKGDDTNRIEYFKSLFSEGGKYYNENFPERVININVNQKPLIYKARTDAYNHKPISSTVVRYDVVNRDFNNFKAAYENMLSRELITVYALYDYYTELCKEVEFSKKDTKKLNDLLQESFSDKQNIKTNKIYPMNRRLNEGVETIKLNITDMAADCQNVDFNVLRDTLTDMGATVMGQIGNGDLQEAEGDDDNVYMIIDGLPEKDVKDAMIDVISQYEEDVTDIAPESYFVNDEDADVTDDIEEIESADADDDIPENDEDIDDVDDDDIVPGQDFPDYDEVDVDDTIEEADFPDWDDVDLDDEINDDVDADEFECWDPENSCFTPIREKKGDCCPKKKHSMVNLSEAIKAFDPKKQKKVDDSVKTIEDIIKSVKGQSIGASEVADAFKKLKAEQNKLKKIAKNEEGDMLSITDVPGVASTFKKMAEVDPSKAEEIKKYQKSLKEQVERALRNNQGYLHENIKVNGKSLKYYSIKEIKKLMMEANSTKIMLTNKLKDSTLNESVESKRTLKDKIANKIRLISLLDEELTYRVTRKNCLAKLNEEEDKEDKGSNGDFSEEDLSKMFGGDQADNADNAEGTEEKKDDNNEEEEVVDLARVVITMEDKEAAEELKKSCLDAGIPENAIEIEEESDEEESEEESEEENSDESKEETSEESEEKEQTNESVKYKNLKRLFEDEETEESDSEDNAEESDEDTDDSEESEEEEKEGAVKFILTDTDYIKDLAKILDDEYGISKEEFEEMIGGEIVDEDEESDEEATEEDDDKKDKSEDSEDEDKPEDDIDPSELFKGL